MLIEFSVGNYRSFKERQTFSMVASKSHENAHSTGFKSAPHLLHTAALFGANASGKSNLIKAIGFFQEFVVESTKDRNKGAPIEWASPFLFAEEWAKKPCEFEIIFIAGKTVYQYGFSIDRTRVHAEWLFATKTGGERARQRTLFERNWDSKTEKYEWDTDNLKEDPHTIVTKTRENALFLSTANMLDSVELDEPFRWIALFLKVAPANSIDIRFTASLLNEKSKRSKIMKMFQRIDTGIIDFEIKEKTFSESDLPKNMPASLKQEILKDMRTKKRPDIYSIHKTDGAGTVALNFDEESDGTQIFFGLSGPIIDILENGYTFAVDELDNSLHPLLLKEIVRLFSDKKVNKKKAQLIFTAHDTNVLEEMDRDQIWLLEKEKGEETRLFSILEYKPRKDENIRKSYLSGRYGGLPAIERLIND